MKTFFKYLLFQIPEWILLGLFLWLLVDRTAVPLWLSQVFFGFWVAKDFAIYPWVRRAYQNDARIGTDQLIGVKGVAQEALNPEGYIKIQGELWKARLAAPDGVVQPETVVKVCAARGMTLIVQSEAQYA